MAKPNLKKKMNPDKIEAIQLLPKIDVKSVKNYMTEILRQPHIKKSEFSSKCLICPSSLLKSWQNLVQHLRDPSHINNIKKDSKQFTAFCILCRYILIAEDTDFIFEHFILHRAATSQSDSQTVQKSFDNDPTNTSSIISSCTSNYKDDKNIDTNLIKYKHEFQIENKPFENEHTFGNIKKSAPEKILTNNSIKSNIEQSAMIGINDTTSNPATKSTPTIFKDIQEVGRKFLTENHSDSISLKKNAEALNFDDNDYGIIRQPKLGVNCSKTLNKRDGATSIVAPFTKDIRNESIKTTYFQNFIPESYKKKIYPKKAFFSNTILQLSSPGVSKNEFTVSQELNIENISDYCKKTYYSSYYSLRKLYYSCLECNALRLQKKYFFKHLIGAKHYNNIEECYNTGFIKICDICQVLLLGHIDLIEEHFQSNTHKQNLKFKMGLIKQQFAVISDEIKLGFSGELTDRSAAFFSSKEALNSWVESSLKEAREVASLAVSLLEILERDINKTLAERYSNFCVKVLGSRLYELANHGSDVDIHLSIGDVSIGDLEIYFHRAACLFEVMRTILNAKVPIIRIKHLPTSLICDINTTNPSGPYCSELIKLYITLDDRVRWLAMAVMEWGAENDIRGARKFKSYALMGLVLFFLMSPKIRLIPSVHELKELYEGSRVYIKGWDYSFCRDIEKIKKIYNPLLCNLNKYELLVEFFKYYASLDTKRSVLFPHNGEVYRKVVFANPSLNIYPGIHTNQEDNEPLSVGGQFVLIDFFCLRENINKSVDQNLSDHFKSICHKTLSCGWQN